MAKDLTGPVGVWTQVQDVLLFKLHGASEGERQRLVLAAMACAFMVQCSVDSKKNSIPLYPWWELSNPDNWVQTGRGSRVLWSPREQWLKQATVSGYQKVPGTKMLAMKDGGLNIGAAYAWLTSLLGGEKLHDQYLKSLGTDRRCVPEFFWGTEEDGQLSQAGKAFAPHPLHAVYNRVREMAYATPGMKRFFSTGETASLANAWQEMNLQDKSPAEEVSGETIKALQGAKNGLRQAIANKAEFAKGGAAVKAALVREEDRIIGAKILVGELVSELTMPQNTALVMSGVLDWADFSYGENALTRLLGITLQECSWFSRNREEIMALKSGEEQQLFLYGYTVQDGELAPVPAEMAHPEEGAHACKECQDAFKASVLLSRKANFSKEKVASLIKALNESLKDESVQEQLRELLDQEEPF